MELAKVVERTAPFHKMRELALKPVPIKVNVNPALPACVVDGLRLLITGFPAVEVIVNVELLDTVRPPLTTTVTAPGYMTSSASTAAIN